MIDEGAKDNLLKALNEANLIRSKDLKVREAPVEYALGNPGSKRASDNGCICAVLDNHHGTGSHWGDGVFIITVGCPAHPEVNKSA